MHLLAVHSHNDRMSHRSGFVAFTREPHSRKLGEVAEIATTGDKMLMEEVLSNIGWTSTAVFQTDVLASHPAVCDST